MGLLETFYKHSNSVCVRLFTCICNQLNVGDLLFTVRDWSCRKDEQGKPAPSLQFVVCSDSLEKTNQILNERLNSMQVQPLTKLGGERTNRLAQLLDYCCLHELRDAKTSTCLQCGCLLRDEKVEFAWFDPPDLMDFCLAVFRLQDQRLCCGDCTSCRDGRRSLQIAKCSALCYVLRAPACLHQSLRLFLQAASRYT
jgi:hypothetical protein